MRPATHILVVEDDDDIRAAMSALLSAEGHRVSAARDGREALAALRSGATPDVIVLDLMMPVMSGAEFRAAQLRDPQLAAIPVVVITAGVAPRQAAKTLEAAAVLPKPFGPEELMGVIERVAVRAPTKALASA